ncbi:hypothetical protein ANRL1_01400 [Anaerolineae bacterium]|nr:hypothetical protein ANRL1_01400 [Anaerolineae bacterium]
MNPPTEWAVQRRAMRRFSLALIGLLVVLIVGSAGYRWLEGMDFLDDVTHAGGLELLLEQVHLAPTSALVGQTLAQAQLRERFGVTVLACRLPDGCVNTNLEPNTVLQAESDVIALGTREQLQAVMKLARE